MPSRGPTLSLNPAMLRNPYANRIAHSVRFFLSKKPPNFVPCFEPNSKSAHPTNLQFPISPPPQMVVSVNRGTPDGPGQWCRDDNGSAFRPLSSPSTGTPPRGRYTNTRCVPGGVYPAHHHPPPPPSQAAAAVSASGRRRGQGLGPPFKPLLACAGYPHPP